MRRKISLAIWARLCEEQGIGIAGHKKPGIEAGVNEVLDAVIYYIEDNS